MSNVRRTRAAAVPDRADPGAQVIAAWRTSNRATTYLIENLPAGIWSSAVPGVPRKTVRSIAAHLHNSRCSWIQALGAAHGVAVPKPVDLRRVGQRALVRELAKSSAGMIRLIELAQARGGRLPRAIWQNFPTDLEHFLGYFAAHEGHHRGQLCMIAWQLGHRLPQRVTGGIWQWTRFAREAPAGV